MHDTQLTFRDYLRTTAQTIDSAIQRRLSSLPDGQLSGPINHTLKGGKRMRGFLAMESARIHGVDPEHSLACAVAIELIHAYSLVHDDLPCMDDDPLRRGQPTVHVKWDEATAVLVGDALQSLAFEVLLDPAGIPDADLRSNLALSLAQRSGVAGMAGGQALDISAESDRDPPTVEDILELQRLKTGALIVWSAASGPILAREDPAAMLAYAEALGVAYQVADDLLDHTGNTQQLGKTAGKDAEAGKATLVGLLGGSRAREWADALAAKALDALKPYGDRAHMLAEAIAFTVRRKR
ncbi:MAG: polyprenyl synthetase family protein [Rhodobacteraceae bacterium]|nr:polyprenyl synthetase family protein [Paracoccaceae bacterium]